MHCDFKRSVNNKVTNTILCLGVIILLLALALAVAKEFNFVHQNEAQVIPVLIGLTITGVCFEVAAAVVSSIIPPDFKYTIRVIEDEGREFLIFENGDNDHRRLSTKFEITEKSYKNMTLDDGYARICINYDKSVVEFLNGVKK